MNTGNVFQANNENDLVRWCNGSVKIAFDISFSNLIDRLFHRPLQYLKLFFQQSDLY